MPQNPPQDHKTLARKLADLEKRIKALETAPRNGKASVSGGKLTIGDPTSDNRIEMDGAGQEVAFVSSAVDVSLVAFDEDIGVVLDSNTDPGQVLSVPTRAYLWNGATIVKCAVTNPDTTGHDAFVGVGFTEDSGDVVAVAEILAHSEDSPDKSIIELDADGGVIIFSYSRSTNPPDPGPGRAVLFMKGNQLWVRDGDGSRQV